MHIFKICNPLCWWLAYFGTNMKTVYERITISNIDDTDDFSDFVTNMYLINNDEENRLVEVESDEDIL